MNPKISIAVDSKNKAVATITGMATVGAKIDVEVTGIAATDVPTWGSDDDYTGYSLRFRIVDVMGKDLVRYQLVKKTETTPDVWTWDATNSKFTATGVDFDTDVLRKAFVGVPYNETLEFGIILDSIVDKAQYAVGKIKIRQWAVASTEDPTVLPDWRETLAELNEDLEAVEASKTAAAASATSAASSASSASTSASAAAGSALSALGYQNTAGTYATTASNAKTAAETAQAAAETAASHYPKINTSTNKWQVWDVTAGAYVDTSVNATGDDGISPHIDSTTGNWFIGTTDTGVHAKGDTGAGVPTGGTAGQFLIKKSGTDYDTEWKSQEWLTLDSEVTQSSANGVKSSGIWNWVKGLLPSWLTSSYAEPATVASVTAKYTKPSDGIPKTDLASGVQTSLGLADTALQSHQDISGKQDKIYTTSTTATFTAPSTVTVESSGGETKTLTAEYSGLALVDGDWICTAYFLGDGVSEDVEFSTSDGGHTESETSINFGTQPFSIVIDQTTFTGSVAISATRTSTTTYCGAEADKTPTEDSNKLVTSGGVYDAVEAAISADVTHAKSISATGISTPCEPDENGDVDVSSLFGSENTLLVNATNAIIAERVSSLDPSTASISDLIKSLKGV